MFIMSCPSGISALFLWTVHFHACQPKTIHLTIHARHYALGGGVGGDWEGNNSLASKTHPEPLQARPNTVPGNDPSREQQTALAKCVCTRRKHRLRRAV